jgi:hypothetical protein
VLAAGTLAGCLPFGNQSEPTELYPADSLSKRLAADIESTPLRIDFRLEPDTASYFASMQLGPDSTVWIGNLASGSIDRFTLAGQPLESIRHTEMTYPYLSGAVDSTVYVYDAGSERLITVNHGVVDDVRDLPVRAGAMNLARSIAVFGNHVYVKDTGRGDAATLTVLTRSDPTSLPNRTRLRGEAWRYHGVMRPWNGRITGSSAFQPVLYMFQPSWPVDSLRLKGFDSPMLARSRAFALGDVSDPPLMISAFSASGANLFVLNVRPGTIRIDEYDAKGVLQRIFEWIAPEPEAFTPVDLLTIKQPAEDPVFFVVSTAAEYGALSLDYRSRFDRLTPVSEAQTTDPS